MGMGATDNQDDFDEQINVIEEMGFDHFSKFRATMGSYTLWSKRTT